jgi:hypothetical protein
MRIQRQILSVHRLNSSVLVDSNVQFIAQFSDFLPQIPRGHRIDPILAPQPVSPLLSILKQSRLNLFLNPSFQLRQPVGFLPKPEQLLRLLLALLSLCGCTPGVDSTNDGSDERRDHADRNDAGGDGGDSLRCPRSLRLSNRRGRRRDELVPTIAFDRCSDDLRCDLLGLQATRTSDCEHWHESHRRPLSVC